LHPKIKERRALAHPFVPLDRLPYPDHEHYFQNTSSIPGPHAVPTEETRLYFSGKGEDARLSPRQPKRIGIVFVFL